MFWSLVVPNMGCLLGIKPLVPPWKPYDRGSADPATGRALLFFTRRLLAGSGSVLMALKGLTFKRQWCRVTLGKGSVTVHVS